MSGSVLEISDLRAAIGDTEIITGLDLTVRSGEVHAIMGPNGSGKSTLSHVLMGRPGYTVLGGSVRLGGVELLDLPTWERSQAGLFLALQYPTEVPGVRVRDLFEASFAAAGRDTDQIPALVGAEAEAIGFGEQFLDRALNVDLSGGEKKRNETLQLGVLAPRFAILDELDSGLDVDALRMCARRIEQATDRSGLGVIAITHYSRLFSELRPDVVHVFAGGTIAETGGPELADRLEDEGYAAWVTAEEPTAAPLADPFADPFA